MNARQLLVYVLGREIFIERNTTGDIFCAGCLQATANKDDVSSCCGKEVLTKEEALNRIPVLVKRLKEMM